MTKIKHEVTLSPNYIHNMDNKIPNPKATFRFNLVFLRSNRTQKALTLSLTSCDGPNMTSVPIACLVNCIDVAVIVTGRLKVSYYSGGVEEGEVDHFSSGLRINLQTIILSRSHISPFYRDRRTG